jgi:hypothetical protein
LKIGDRLVIDSKSTADPFADHFKSVRNISSSHSATSDFLPTAPISAVGISKAIKRLKHSKCVGVDEIPSLIIKGRPHTFISLLIFMFNLSATTETFPSL